MRRSLSAIAAFLPVLFIAPLGAVTIGQVQTFDDPDHGWVIGAGPVLGSPTLLPIELGGPGGASDPYLSMVATGGTGPGSRLSAQNFGQWAGDYTGVTHLRMDVRNFGPDDVSLRLLFLEFGAMGPVSGALTTTPVVLASGSDWQTVQLDVTAPALTGLFGSLAGARSNAGEVRIFHNPQPTFPVGNIPAVNATIGVDNITAAAIPEPSTWMMLGSGLLLASGYRAVRRK